MKKKQQIKTSNHNRLWNFAFIGLIILVAIGAVLLVFYIFFSGEIKKTLLALIFLAYAGATNIREGIAGVSRILLTGVIIFLLIWLMESSEYKAGMTAYENGDYSTAIKQFDLDLIRDPDQANVLLVRCKALRKSGQAKQALSDCNKAIRLKYYDETESYAAKARIYSDIGKYKEALLNFTAALNHYDWSTSESEWYLLYERGIANLNVGNNNDAIKDLKHVLSLKENWYPVWLPMGNAYYNKGNIKNAHQSYEKYMSNYNPKQDLLPETVKKRIFDLRKSNTRNKNDKK